MQENFDVFISYRDKTGSGYARAVYEYLNKYKLKIFLDVEELKGGKFNEKLYAKIENSKNFILILTPGDLDPRPEGVDDWVKFEYEHALDTGVNIVPVKFQKFQFDPSQSESIRQLSLCNDVEIHRGYFPDAMNKLLFNRLTGVKIERKDESTDTTNETYKHVGREKNQYFEEEDWKEDIDRLNVQQEILKLFDIDIYEKLINKFDKLDILDVGSNNGDLIIDRFGDSDKLERIFALEYDEEITEMANKKYGNEKVSFHSINVDNDTFYEDLQKCLSDNNLANHKFNIIHVSMLILHIQNAFKLLRTLRKFLSPDGIIFIRDIDDRLTYAYKDDSDYSFEKAIDICNYIESTGHRTSGREIYTHLKKSGFRNITLQKAGLTTINMTYEQREALFNTYFPFVRSDLLLMIDKYPEIEQYKNDYDWICSKYDDLEQKFQEDSFFFSLGFMTYTASINDDVNI